MWGPTPPPPPEYNIMTDARRSHIICRSRFSPSVPPSRARDGTPRVFITAKRKKKKKKLKTTLARFPYAKFLHNNNIILGVNVCAIRWCNESRTWVAITNMFSHYFSCGINYGQNKIIIFFFFFFWSLEHDNLILLWR